MIFYLFFKKLFLNKPPQIDEDFLSGEEVIDVDATDNDKGNHGQITYSIRSMLKVS